MVGNSNQVGGGGGGGGISAKGFFTHCKKASTIHTLPVKLVTLISYGSVYMSVKNNRYPKKLHLTVDKYIVLTLSGGSEWGSRKHSINFYDRQ